MLAIIGRRFTVRRPAAIRVFAPADHRKIEFADQPVGEWHAGEPRQSQGVVGGSDFDTCAFGQRALATAIATNPPVGDGTVENIEALPGSVSSI